MSLRVLAIIALLLISPAVVRAEGDARYEAALLKAFELTFKREVIDSGVEEAVDGFLKGIEKESSLKTCPAANEVMREFADKQFREAVSAYLNSKEFRDIILEGMRKHYTQEDLDAYLAFAATPGGASFIEHSAKAELEVSKLVKVRMANLEDSPQISKMLSQLGAVLMVPMMKCQSK